MLTHRASDEALLPHRWLADCGRRLIAQGLTLPIQLGVFPAAMRKVVIQYGVSGKPGDVYIMNDRYASDGMHGQVST
ncbi:hypothetical protein [Paraburkholderia sp.]|uniref:hypothetical protein n=1 Tax=Paraburkholderia sp. TaxID=1926495 RepID=UPI003C7DC5BE